MKKYSPMSVKKFQDYLLSTVFKMNADSSDFCGQSVDHAMFWFKVLQTCKKASKPSKAYEVADVDEIVILSSKKVKELMEEFNNIQRIKECV